MEAIANSNKIKSSNNNNREIFNAQAFLDSAGAARVVQLEGLEQAYAQGDPAASVMYIQEGQVKLSVVNEAGKEAIVAILGPGDFFGEGCLAGQPLRMGTATALIPTTMLVIQKDEMARVLHEEHALAHRFIAHMLSRNIRIEEDLV